MIKNVRSPYPIPSCVATRGCGSYHEKNTKLPKSPANAPTSAPAMIVAVLRIDPFPVPLVGPKKPLPSLDPPTPKDQLPLPGDP